jgi:predicted transcriptional regulator
MCAQRAESTKTVEHAFFSVRVDRATHEALEQLARRNDRSIAAELRIAVRDHLSKAAAA